MLAALLALANRSPGITVAEAASQLGVRPDEVRTATLLLRRLGRLPTTCDTPANSCRSCALVAACRPAAVHPR